MARLHIPEKLHNGPFFALLGAAIGLPTPVGWIALQLLFFRSDASQDWWQAALTSAAGSAENLALTLYMSIGTAMVFALFGYFIGLASQALQLRAKNLDQLNQTVNRQKEEFQSKFRTLNTNLKNFHDSNARIQNSVDSREAVLLAAESLHSILGYDRVNVLMLNGKGDHLNFVASLGTGDTQVDGLSFPLDGRAGIIHKAMVENRLFLVEDMQQMPADYHLSPPWDTVKQLRSRSFILAPIAVHGRAIGLFGVDNKRSHKHLDDTDVDTVRLFADQVSSVLNKIQLLDAVETLTGELQQTFAEMKKYRSRYGELIQSLKTGAAATAETIAAIAESAEVVRTVVDDTGSAASEISMAVEEVTSNLDRLQQFMEQSVSAMTQITATAKEVDSNSVRSHQMSETVRGNAETGVETVTEAFRELESISQAVDQTHHAIAGLARKGEQIDNIITVIHEVNQKTNLLSLNASIIAAQAGEYGRPFAVVAEEIRKLSQETVQSAGTIEILVEEIRSFTDQAVRHIGETRQLVARDIGLGQKTDLALRRILNSAGEAMGMTREIRKATTEQVRSSQTVSRSIEELGDMSSQLSHASREQVQGIRRIAQAIEEIKAMAEEMARSTAHQTKATRRVDDEVDMVNDMANRIFTAMSQRESQSHLVIEQLEEIKQLSRRKPAPTADH